MFGLSLVYKNFNCSIEVRTYEHIPAAFLSLFNHWILSYVRALQKILKEEKDYICSVVINASTIITNFILHLHSECRHLPRILVL